MTLPARHSYEERISRLRLWTLLPVLIVPGTIKSLGDRMGVDPNVSFAWTLQLAYVLVLAWWLVMVAPRPYSVQAAMGRVPDLAGWRVMVVALFGVTCLRLVWWLAPHAGELVMAARNGHAYPFSAAGAMPEFLPILSAVVLTPIVEELIHRGTLFRKWRVRWGPGKAALLSAAVFGVVFHSHKVTACMTGLTYALLYTRTRSLWTSMAMHAVNNGMLYAVAVLSYLWADRKTIYLTSEWHYVALALLLVLGIGIWVRFVVQSWRTLGDPLPPDSLQATSVMSPSGPPGPARVGA